MRRDFAGQGRQAYDCFCRAHDLNRARSDAIINATLLAPDEREFRRWVDSCRGAVPDSERAFKEIVEGLLRALEQGSEYSTLMRDMALGLASGGETGRAAATMGIALASHSLPPVEEAGERRWRAQQLRTVDQKDEDLRRAHCEHFPPEERLALQEALAELNRAIAGDDCDAEVWNLKSVYSLRLDYSEEALAAADRSVKLRPHGYAKPHINRALALWALKRDAEALEAAREAQSRALDAGDAADQQRAQELIELFSRPRPSPTLQSWAPLIEEFVTKSTIIAGREIEESRADPKVVVGGFFNRCRKLAHGSSLAFVPALAELMSDSCPERVFQVVSAIPQMPRLLTRWTGQPFDATAMAPLCRAVYDHCLHAALYVASHSSTIMRRDAARFVCLTILGALDPTAVRRVYRESILETSAAASDEFSQLAGVIRAELASISPGLATAIADQEPVDEAGRERARRRILSRFQVDPHAGPTAGGVGCAPALLLSAVALLFYAIMALP